MIPFSQRIEQEFCQGSAIGPDLFQSAIRLIEDTGRWETHEAIGFEVSRFWQTRQPHDFGILAALQNEDGSLWQVKPEHPLTDSKGKIQKYQTPKGNGARAFLPTIPDRVRQAIAQRYQCEIPADGSFWAWLEQHSEIEIIWTEGGKKALALLSQGYVAISLYGVNGGYRKLPDDTRELIPDVGRFAQPGRVHVLAFDQDEHLKTRHKVNAALSRFGGLLERSGGLVKVATWDRHQGKGVDDLIVNGGAAAWDCTYAEALALKHWQIAQRLNSRLPGTPSIQVSTHDLSTLTTDQIPATGIIAIAAPKGTGKTKLIGQLVQGADKVLCANHRIALGRNLCDRLGIDYRGDLDKTPDGRFIAGTAYTLRVGTCVDALLAFDPAQFEDCDLIVDEAVQVVRHLLTSETCKQLRPALLARFARLVQTARRVILADADLDKATLHYFQDLRGDRAPICLIRNDYQAAGYPVRLVQTHSFESVVSDLLDDLHHQPLGQATFVTTDNKRTTQAIARLVANSCPDKRVLVINSETSGGEAEREFIQNPDAVLRRGEYDLVIASPSLATGVSIEAQGIISKVYGIFTGVSSTDADILQALARVREPVPRVVWVANRGRNWNRVSRSTNPLQVKESLMQRTTAIAGLIGAIDNIDYQNDPHLNLWCRIAADQNWAMQNLRDAVLMRLKLEGHQVTLEDREYDPVARFLYQQAATQQKRQAAEAIANADSLNYAEVKFLEQKEHRTPAEQQAIQRFYLCDFYAIDPESLTPEFVLWDADGRRRGELLNLESMLYENVAVDRTVRALEKQLGWNQGVCPWDISGAALRAELRRNLGLDQYLDPEREWTGEDNAAIAALARGHFKVIQDVLHFSPSDKLSDTQIAHQLLSQLGLKVISRWQGTGKHKHRVYRLEAARWELLTAILERRAARRSRLQSQASEPGSPLPLIFKNQTGDPKTETRQIPTEEAGWRNPDSLADVRDWWAQADTDEIRAEIRRMVPPDVLALAIAS